MKLTKEIAQKVLSTVDAGLCSGKGNPVPGEMCVEAAVCFALGLPHGDNPPCVGSAVRSFKITLNDCTWSSNAARASGLRRIAIAQLGSESLDQKDFAQQLALKAVQSIVPIALRAAAKLFKDGHEITLEQAALTCEQSTDLGSAAESAESAESAAESAESAAESAESAESARSAADKALSDMAEIGVQVLIELNSPGCKWLHLCD